MCYRFEFTDLILFHKILHGLIQVKFPPYLHFYSGKSRLRFCHLDTLSLVCDIIPSSTASQDRTTNAFANSFLMKAPGDAGTCHQWQKPAITWQQPAKTRKPAHTHQSRSKPAKTRQKPAKPIKTRQTSSVPVKIRQHSYAYTCYTHFTLINGTVYTFISEEVEID